jgi:glycosyltransferase involved in cell wall biosynthesis
MASSRPDHIIAISEEVRRRIQHYYRRDSHVIYPPVSLFAGEDVRSKDGSYFLVVSRLVSYKRIDLAIEACNELKLPLKIIGVGGELQRLQQLAGPTIQFLGSVPDALLKDYYRGAKALLFPGFEDFGITMAEAAGFGVPVIAYEAGGAVEIVKEGETGLFFTPQTKEALITVLKQFDATQFRPKAMLVQAERFSQQRFLTEFQETLARLFPKLFF